MTTFLGGFGGLKCLVAPWLRSRRGRALSRLGLAQCLLALSCAPSLADGLILLDPQGPVASAQISLMGLATALMMIVVLPVFILTTIFVRRYAANGGKGRYTPDWGRSWKLEVLVWSVPVLIVLGLAYMAWTQTHHLDPYKPLPSDQAPITVQAVALDWQWLFIYPDQGIASVNQLVMPADRDIALQITSDTVMNSFYLPQLAGQIYAMAGMVTQLHIMADGPGEFAGRNSQFSGQGFAHNTFVAKALSADDFDNWVSTTKAGGGTLDAASYTSLAEPTIGAEVSTYASVAPDLFHGIVSRYGKGRVAPHKPAVSGE